MKFRKIEIDAFRAYRDKEEGTFDFALPNGGAAQLISIYAPNGFGKTSFFDAIEWGITNRVQRFDWLQKEGLNEKQNVEGQFVLKNKYSPDKETGKVTIYPVNGEPIVNETVQVNGNTRSDYYFKGERSKKRHEYFQRVILSQEGINAFLRSEDPASRYDQFSKHFGDEKLERYFKNIVALIRENDHKIDYLVDESKRLEKEINDRVVDPEVIRVIEKQLTKLRSYKEDIPVFNENSAVTIIQEVNDISGSLLLEEKKLKEQLDSAEELLKKFHIYVTNCAELAKVTAEIERLEIIIQRYKALHELKKHLNREKELRNKYQEQLDACINILPQYFELSKNIKSLRKQRVELREKQGLKEGKQEEVSTSVLRLENHLKSITEKVEKVLSLIGELDAKHEKYVRLKAQNESFVSQRLEIEKIIQVLNGDIRNLDEELLELQYFNQALKGSYAALSKYNRVYALVQNKLLELKDNQQSQLNIEKSLENCVKKKKQLVSLEENIFDLISFGRQVIEQLKGNSCPLCGNSEFEDKETLLAAIERNSLLSNDKDKLALEEAANQNQLNKLREESALIIASIKNSLHDRQEFLEGNKLKLKQSVEEFKQRFISLDQEWQLDADNFNYLTQYFLEGKQKQLDTLEDEKRNLDSKKEELLTELGKERDNLKELNLEVEKIAQDLKFTLAKLQELEADSVIDSFSTLAKKYNNLNSITLDNLEEEKSVLREKISKTDDSIGSLNSEIDKNENELSKYQEEEIVESLITWKNQFLMLKEVVYSYKASLRSIKIENVDPSNCSRELEAKIEQLKVYSIKLIEFIRITDNLEEHFENFKKFQEAAKLNEDLQGILEKQVKLKEIGKSLEKSKGQIAEELKKHIKDFFQEELINDIYQRIDPHPDYKEISFYPDLSGNKGCLYIRVKEKGGTEEYSPVLYLSSAQVNVLSLSIFLARALHAVDDQGKPVDCIFMDDPVQSMDSINVLSLIDLLRSIIFNHEKQVIISTHDDNFHHLLQKKIPEEFFSAKFLELDSFGKVKKHLEY